MELDRLLYSPEEAASVASVSRPTIYRWMKIDGFPVAHIGGCTRIPVEAFQRWIDEQVGGTARA